MIGEIYGIEERLCTLWFLDYPKYMRLILYQVQRGVAATFDDLSSRHIYLLCCMLMLLYDRLCVHIYI